MQKKIMIMMLVLMGATLPAKSWNYKGLNYATIDKRHHTAMLAPQEEEVARNLKVVKIPRVVWHKGWHYHVTTIGRSALGGCWLLQYVSVPDGVTRIEPGAMAWCINLETVEVPESIGEIDEAVFENSPKVKVVVRDGRKGNNVNE